MLRGPDPDRGGVPAWRIANLCSITGERFGATCREGGVGRLLRGLDLP